MRSSCRISLTLFVILGLMSLTISANAFFENYPEEKVFGWQTPYPFQRHIYHDFSTDPGSASGPIPGAEYDGYFDSEMRDSDYLTYTGLTLDSGRIGVSDGGSGEIVVYLKNLENSNPAKRIYIEATVTASSFAAYKWLDADYRLPDGHDIIDDGYEFKVKDFLNKKVVLQGWVEIQPNPGWEKAVVSFNVPQGQWAWVHDIRIASECTAPTDCDGDFEFDGDVDGSDLTRLIKYEIDVDLDTFADNFGRTECVELSS